MKQTKNMKNNTLNPETKEETKEEVKSPYYLILHNDDFNSFNWVITCLMKFCDHGHEQATQCAYIVHFKGKCTIKKGDIEKLKEIKEKLDSCGLSTTLEKDS